MAEYRVRDRKGGTLTVTGKEQADYWVGLGYTLVADEKPAQKATTTKSTSRTRRTADK